jgi:hypothetical protein
MTVRGRWLKYAEIAELLGVTPRTIKLWMRRPGGPQAFLAVRQGSQWRVPCPENLEIWASETRERLIGIGIRLKSDLQELADQNEPYWPEVHRLYLGAFRKALGVGRVTVLAKDRIDELCRMALELLRSRKQRTGVAGFKHLFPRRLWRYWPSRSDFEAALSVKSEGEIEKERRNLDFFQAVRQLRRKGQDPTGPNLCRFLHLDWKAHINDTKEKLPPGTIKADIPRKLSRLIKKDKKLSRTKKDKKLWRLIKKDVLMHMGGFTRHIVEGWDDQGKTFATFEMDLTRKLPPTFVDLRQPQKGISIHQFRRRYCLRKPPWKSIIAKIYGIQASVGPEEL